MSDLAIPLPEDVVETIVAIVKERVLAQLDDGRSPWLTRKQAAAYLSVPLSRLEKDRTAPCHRWDGRVLYHRNELDEYLQGL